MMVNRNDGLNINPAQSVVEKTAGIFRHIVPPDHPTDIDAIIEIEKRGFEEAIVQDWIETERRMRPDYVREDKTDQAQNSVSPNMTGQ
jgi:hypothetical protein